MTAWDLVVEPDPVGAVGSGVDLGERRPVLRHSNPELPRLAADDLHVYLAYRAIEQRVAPPGLGPMERAPPVLWARAPRRLPVVAYGLMLASDLLSGVEPAGVAIVGPLVMGPPLALAAWRLCRSGGAPKGRVD